MTVMKTVILCTTQKHFADCGIMNASTRSLHRAWEKVCVKRKKEGEDSRPVQ